MNICSQETLRKVEENDAELTILWICNTYLGGMFNSTDGDDFSRLGSAIGENTHLTRFEVVLRDTVALDVTNNEFYDGIKQNSSIQVLTLNFRNSNIAGGVGQKILEAYQENNNLIHLKVYNTNENRREQILAESLRGCTNLREFELLYCNVADEQLLPMVEAIRDHRSLEKLHLDRDGIGNAGCEVLVTLLSDPNCNLRSLTLVGNNIDNDGAATLANGLANNTKMKELFLGGNLIDLSSVNIFKKLLCDKSSINNTYSSNHTLEKLDMYPQRRGDELRSLLKLNREANKSHVAIKKILKYHPSIVMEPFFEWNMEREGERDLKALPYVVAWFERAGDAVASDEGGESYYIGDRKLSAMYQFVRAMPLLFVPVPHDKGGGIKRKRDVK